MGEESVSEKVTKRMAPSVMPRVEQQRRCGCRGVVTSLESADRQLPQGIKSV